MGIIITISIMVIIFILMAIYYLIKKDKSGSIVSIVIIIATSLFLVISIRDYKYGSYKDLITKYGMSHTGYSGSDIYTKNNLTFTTSESNYKFENSYTIEDSEPHDLNLQSYIINKFISMDEGSIQMIYEHLKNNADTHESSSEVFIYGNHYKIHIKYTSITKEIKYTIIEEKQYKYESDYDNKEKRITNKDYEKKYVINELRIEHYNDDYQEFDNKLIKLLFGDNSKPIISDNYIYGYHRLSYCFSKNCIYND